MDLCTKKHIYQSKCLFFFSCISTVCILKKIKQYNACFVKPISAVTSFCFNPDYTNGPIPFCDQYMCMLVVYASCKLLCFGQMFVCLKGQIFWIFLWFSRKNTFEMVSTQSRSAFLSFCKMSHCTFGISLYANKQTNRQSAGKTEWLGLKSLKFSLNQKDI